MIGRPLHPYLFRAPNSRVSIRVGCATGSDGMDISKGKALPGGGYLLPNPILVEAGFLYGPGRLGFAMFKNGSDSSTKSLNLIPYDSGHPPVRLPEEQEEATISIDLAEGTIYEVVAEPVEEPRIDLKLLGSGNIAGMLPPAPADDDIKAGDETEQESDDAEKLFVGAQTSPRRTLRISFTCNMCGSRNVRSVNPLAWSNGTVFLQCAGCKVHHKVVDHLNLTTEFGAGVDTNIVEMQREIARLERLAVTRSLMPDRMQPMEPHEE